MEPEAGATVIRLILAWGAPFLFLVVVSVRFFRQSHKRGARRRAGVAKPITPSMRRRDRAITEPERVDAILGSSAVCRIALAVDNVPYLVPLSYGVADRVAGLMELDETRSRFVAGVRGPCRVYFHAATEGRKLDMARANRSVCFEVEGRVDVREGAAPCDWSVAYESVMGFGRLSEITAPEEKRAGLECIMRQNGATGPFNFPDDALAGTSVLRLDLSEITGKSNRQPEADTRPGG